MTAESGSIVEVEAIQKRFGRRTVLDGITCSFRRGRAPARVGAQTAREKNHKKKHKPRTILNKKKKKTTATPNKDNQNHGEQKNTNTPKNNKKAPTTAQGSLW